VSGRSLRSLEHLGQQVRVFLEERVDLVQDVLQDIGRPIGPLFVLDVLKPLLGVLVVEREHGIREVLEFRVVLESASIDIELPKGETDDALHEPGAERRLHQVPDLLAVLEMEVHPALMLDEDPGLLRAGLRRVELERDWP
jgi:hypothetical protein